MLGREEGKVINVRDFNDRMLQVMIAQILPPATLCFCVFSSFSMLLSSSGLLGLTVLDVPALEPVCRAPSAAEQAWRRSGGGCAVALP